MNIDIATIKTKIIPILAWLKRHRTLLGILAVLLIYGWLVFKIKTMTSREPTQGAIDEKLRTIKRPRIDQKTIDKIENLQDTNVDVQTLFKSARDNPFQE